MGSAAPETHQQASLPGSCWSRECDEACGGIREPLAKRLYVGVAAEKDRQRQGQRPAAHEIVRHDLSRRPRAREERVAGCGIQIEGRGQRAHGLDMRPPTFPALQRADGVHRKTGDRRELLLRETRSLAERLELPAK